MVMVFEQSQQALPTLTKLLVRLVTSRDGRSCLLSFCFLQKLVSEFLPQLKKEYHFWMNGADQLNEKNNALHRVVKMQDGEILNRYWDANDTARPESYREDVELTYQSTQEPAILYRHLRAAAESGWDFSCRWFKDQDDFGTIHTTEIIPVDLNCLLFHLEETIAEAYNVLNNNESGNFYKSLAEKRKAAINKYCWNDKEGFYFDYDFVNRQQKHQLTLAGISPLFFQVAAGENTSAIVSVMEKMFLKAGGVVTTPYTTGQQWDAPNGWAPLQWMTIKGLENYGFNELAKEIADRWLQLNADVFKRTGKLMEKYNVVDTNLEAGGGEYPGQDGFGWTNGVFLALSDKYNFRR
jgi:alpha,alpha-trehalase